MFIPLRDRCVQRSLPQHNSLERDNEVARKKHHTGGSDDHLAAVWQIKLQFIQFGILE
jgi:hypothetical protein